MKAKNIKEKMVNNKCIEISILLSVFLSAIIYCYYDYLRFTKKYNAKYENYNSCYDSEFGCCEVYDDCHNSNNNTVYDTTYYIDIKKEDDKGSNCPYLFNLIDDYSETHEEPECTGRFNKDISDIYKNCCTVSYSCDVFIKGDHTWKNNYLSYQGYVRYALVKVLKVDEAGHNCPHNIDIVTNTNINLYHDSIYMYNIIHYILIITSIILLCYYCNTKNIKYTSPDSNDLSDSELP